MASSGIKFKRYILIVGDIILLYFSLWVTLLIRYYGDYSPNLLYDHLMPFTIVYMVWLLIFYIDGLYELGYQKGRMYLISALFRNLVIAGAIAVAFFYFGNDRLFSIKPQKVLLINLVVILALIYCWRQLFYFLAKSPRLAKKIMFIGLNPLVLEIIENTNKKPELGYVARSVFSLEPIDKNLKEKLPTNISINGPESDFKLVCQSGNIDTIISSVDLRDNPSLLNLLFGCLPLKIEFLELSNFYEKITGKIPVNNVRHIWFLENLNENSKRFYEIIKRLLDFIISIISLIISLPFVPFIIIAIKIESPGPFLFKQNRVGRNGKEFLAMKFRTMRQDAEKNGPQWALKNDPRITKFGKFFRKTRIDEIPQLINIIRGEMSLIGPRPERPEFVAQLKKQIPFYEERLLIKPGLTGWAQVMGPAYGGSEHESLEKLQYDLFYIKNRSLGLDLSILLKTVKTILKGSGQ